MEREVHISCRIKRSIWRPNDPMGSKEMEIGPIRHLPKDPHDEFCGNIILTPCLHFECLSFADPPLKRNFLNSLKHLGDILQGQPWVIGGDSI